jgi:hypothetical protein
VTTLCRGAARPAARQIVATAAGVRSANPAARPRLLTGMAPRPLRTLLVAALLGGLAVPVTATADPSNDWAVATITAGPDGATNVVLHLTETGLLTGDAPSVFGYGLSLDDRLLDLRAFNFGLGPERISTSRDAGGIVVDIAPGKHGPSFAGGFDALLGVGRLEPGRKVSQVWFHAGSADDAPTWSLTVGSGSATVDVTYGGGSTAIVAGDPEDGGVSANLDATGIGTVRATRTPAAGIVGATVSHCNACRGSWVAPDGRSGGLFMAAPEWVRLRQPALALVSPEVDVGARGFAGPAGTWRFGWDGLDHVAKENEPAEIVYAPIGDEWHRFAADPVLPSNDCAAGTLVADQTVGTVRVAVRSAAPSATETDVCVRAEDAVSRVGTGAELVVRSTGSGGPSAPELGSDAAACTAPANQQPGPHPYTDLAVLGVRLALDAYRDDTRAMLCVVVGTVGVQVVVPLPAGAPAVDVRPDPVPLAVDGLYPNG